MNGPIRILQRYPTLNRLLFVWAIAALITIALSSLKGYGWENVSRQGVYAFSISTFIWLFTDPGSKILSLQAGQEWPSGWQRNAFLSVGIVTGYAIGMAIGDWYSGWSTWALVSQDMGRLAGMAMMSVVISLGFIGYFYQKEQVAKAQRQAAQSQLKLLESQLEPHMLFNTLANLRVLISADPDRATTMLDHLVAYLRATLGGSRAVMHPLGMEFDRLRDYLELMSVRMGSRLRYTLNLPAELAHHPVPPLLLQPLVENAIKHGLEPKIEGGEILVSARREGEQLLLEVCDTGVGMAAGESDSKDIQTSGFGLSQVAERIHTTYGGLGAINFLANNPHNTAVIASLPYQNSTTKATQA